MLTVEYHLKYTFKYSIVFLRLQLYIARSTLSNDNYVSLIKIMANDQYLTRVTFAYTFLRNVNVLNKMLITQLYLHCSTCINATNNYPHHQMGLLIIKNHSNLWPVTLHSGANCTLFHIPSMYMINEFPVICVLVFRHFASVILSKNYVVQF